MFDRVPESEGYGVKILKCDGKTVSRRNAKPLVNEGFVIVRVTKKIRIKVEMRVRTASGAASVYLVSVAKGAGSREARMHGGNRGKEEDTDVGGDETISKVRCHTVSYLFATA